MNPNSEKQKRKLLFSSRFNYNSLKTKILLLGVGYTTIWAYRNLLKYSGKSIRDNLAIEIISNSSQHAFHGFTGEFLSGLLPVELRYTPQEELFPHATFTAGFVTKVDQIGQKVHYFDYKTQSNQIADYHHLVIGMGARDETERISGTKEYAFTVKDAAGLENTQQRIIEVLDTAKTKLDLNFVVCGGGFAGVELCGNLCEYLELLKVHYPILQKKGYQVHLIQSNSTILPQLSPQFKGLMDYVEQVFKQYNVKIHLNRRIKAFLKDGVLLENDDFIESNLVVSTIGQVVCAPDSVIPFQKDAEKRIKGNPYLQTLDFENIWVGGDVASIQHISGSGACRADALWAIKHGTWIGQNMARTLQNRVLKPFTFYGLGQTGSIGMNKAFSELYGICLTGRLAWWARFGFFLYFMPSRAKAWQTFKYLWRGERQLLPAKKQNEMVKIKVAAYSN
jgi:NADH:ubiquinone reductase (H+-translocating)